MVKAGIALYPCIEKDISFFTVQGKRIRLRFSAKMVWRKGRKRDNAKKKKKYVNDALPAAPFVFFEFLPRSGNRFLVYFLLMKRADCSALMANLRRRQNR